MRCLIVIGVLGMVFFSGCNPRSSSKLGVKPSEAGKCYAKVQYPALYEQITESYLVYTGDDLNQEGLEVNYIVVTPEEKGWVKKKADANCLSADPDDCLVWCMVNIPAVMDTIVEVRDTSLVKDYEIESKTIEYPIRKFKVDWGEVHCEEQLSKTLINSISTKLTELSYLTTPTSVLNKNLKKAIQNYQQDHSLGYGALTVEFTEHLGI